MTKSQKLEFCPSFRPSNARIFAKKRPSFARLFIGPMCTWGPIIGHWVRSLTSLYVYVYVFIYETFLKPCEDLVKTVNVVNVVKT